MGKIKLKPWIVVAFEEYYPGGAMNDVLGFFDTKEEAEEYAKSLKKGWDYIYVTNILEQQEFINARRQ